MVVAVTGDDEDNVIISQIAKMKYAVPKVVARVNNPRNQKTFDQLGIGATVCAATRLLSLIQHEMPEHKFVPLLSFRSEMNSCTLPTLGSVQSIPLARRSATVATMSSTSMQMCP